MHKHATEFGRRICEECRKAAAQNRPIWIVRRTEDATKVSAIGARVAVSADGGTRY